MPTIAAAANAETDFETGDVDARRHRYGSAVSLQAGRHYTIRQLDQLIEDLGERVGQSLALRNVQETSGLDDMARLTDLGPRKPDRLRRYYQEDYKILVPYL